MPTKLKKPTLTERVTHLEGWLIPKENASAAEPDPAWEARRVADQALENERRETCRGLLEAINDELARPERVRSTNRCKNLAAAYQALAGSRQY